MERLTLNYFRILFLMSALPLIRSFLPFIPPEILGFNLSGWAWIGVFLTSVVYLFILKRITFPVWIWIPWMAFLVIYLAFDFSFLGLQLTLQYIVAVLVGFVSSGLKYNGFIIRKISRWLLYLVIAICISSLYFFIITLGQDDVSFGAAQVMTLNVAAVIVLAVYFVTRKRRMLYLFALLAVFPIIQVTRMGLVMMFAIAPLHFANRKIRNKLIMGGLVLIGGIAVFYSDAFQKKTFFSGKGDISDAISFESNDNFDTSGRTALYADVRLGIKKSPILGNGPRSDLKLLNKLNFQISEVHSDYLSVRYNYGLVGLVVLLITFAVQFLHLYFSSKKYKIVIFKIVIYSALTLFIPLLGFMYSDNVLKYAIYFGNFHFALMGISYAILNQRKRRHANISSYTPIQ